MTETEKPAESPAGREEDVMNRLVGEHQRRVYSLALRRTAPRVPAAEKIRKAFGGRPGTALKKQERKREKQAVKEQRREKKQEHRENRSGKRQGRGSGGKR